MWLALALASIVLHMWRLDQAIRCCHTPAMLALHVALGWSLWCQVVQIALLVLMGLWPTKVVTNVKLALLGRLAPKVLAQCARQAKRPALGAVSA